MPGDVDTKEVALVLKVLRRRKRRRIREFGIRRLVLASLGHHVKEVRLRTCLLLRPLLALLDRKLNVVEELRAVRLERRKRAGFRKVFKDALIAYSCSGMAHAEVEEAGIRAVFLTLFDNRVARGANALDARKPISDSARIRSRHEARTGLVDIGKPQFEIHFLRLGDKAGELREVADF